MNHVRMSRSLYVTAYESNISRIAMYTPLWNHDTGRGEPGLGKESKVERRTDENKREENIKK